MADGSAATTPQPKTVAQMLGEIVWLMTQSPLHKQMFICDLEWFCMPAVLREQYRVFYGPDAPAAVALWASVSEETEQRLMEPGAKLRVDEWNNGDRLWLIDLVAPFGGYNEILDDLASSVFDQMPFKFHRVSPSGQIVLTTYDPAANIKGP